MEKFYSINAGVGLPAELGNNLPHGLTEAGCHECPVSLDPAKAPNMSVILPEISNWIQRQFSGQAIVVFAFNDVVFLGRYDASPYARFRYVVKLFKEA